MAVVHPIAPSKSFFNRNRHWKQLLFWTLYRTLYRTNYHGCRCRVQVGRCAAHAPRMRRAVEILASYDDIRARISAPTIIVGFAAGLRGLEPLQDTGPQPRGAGQKGIRVGTGATQQPTGDESTTKASVTGPCGGQGHDSARSRPSACPCSGPAPLILHRRGSSSGSCGSGFQLGLGPCYWKPNGRSPFFPRTVIGGHVRIPQQVLENHPDERGPLSPSAACHYIGAGDYPVGLEEIPQLVVALEGAVLR